MRTLIGVSAVLAMVVGCAAGEAGPELELEALAPAALCVELEGLAELERPWLCRDFANSGWACKGPHAPRADVIVTHSIADAERPINACSFECAGAELEALCEQLGGSCVEQRPNAQSLYVPLCIAR